MHRRAAIHPLKTVVRAFDDVEQAARRAAAGIVFSGEDFAIFAHEQAEGIPESARDAAQALAIGGAAEDTALAATADFCAIGAGERPVLAEIFAE